MSYHRPPLSLLIVLALCTLLPLTLRPAAADDTSVDKPTRDDRLAELVQEVSPFVEKAQGRKFKKKIRVQYASMAEMQSLMMGGGMMPDPSSMQRKIRMMATSELGLAALGILPEEGAMRWIDGNGKLQLNPYLAMSGPMSCGGPGGMCGPGDMPAMGQMPQGILGAFYDESAKRIALILGGGEPDEALVKQILVHELTHALDDQYEDLSRFSPEGSELTGDRLAAAMALVEGHAVNAELDWATRHQSKGTISTVLEKKDLEPHGGYLKADGTPAPRKGPDGKVLERPQGMGQMPAGMPKLFLKSKVFPYSHGFEMVKALRLRNIPLSEAYDRPPQSTEQILHPARYLGEFHDTPTRVDLTEAFATVLKEHEAELLAANIKGEFALRCILEEMKIIDANGAAAGWDGDRFATIHQDDSLGYVWATTWDSAADAFEFEAAARELIKRHREGRPGIVLRSGSDVLLAVGLTEKTFEALEELGVSALLKKSAWPTDDD